ncbi:MAG: hypothetical protein RLP14_03245 [Owenweeksia sp.]
MKNISTLALFLILLGSFPAFSQKFYALELKPDGPINIPGRSFYIDSVIDGRETVKLGTVYTGLLNNPRQARFSENFSVAVQRFFNTALNQRDNQLPVTLLIHTLSIDEIIKVFSEHSYAALKASFYHNGKLLLTVEHEVKRSGFDVTSQHVSNISELLEKAVLDFHNSGEPGNLTPDKVFGTDPYVIANPALDHPESGKSGEKTASSKTIIVQPEENRNIIAIGYQIGGYTLIGLDYEARFHDYFGFHFGGGFRGYTVGAKIHVGPQKNSPFINLSYKDGGFGLIQAGALEFGGRIPFSSSKKNSLGLHMQFGFAKIITIDGSLERQLFNGEAPNVMFSLGVGLSW